MKVEYIGISEIYIFEKYYLVHEDKNITDELKINLNSNILQLYGLSREERMYLDSVHSSLQITLKIGSSGTYRGSPIYFMNRTEFNKVLKDLYKTG
jgi:hypothetical protein